ncbi:MAG: hypothetical protein H5U40_19005 [Polyangiaceae bacterium]|nr:hypothetical protein [Polyangiaceae bacterium]
MNLTHILRAAVLGLFLLGGCGGGTVQFTGSQRVVGADGEARWKEIAGGAILVEVEMTNLPPPSRLGQGLTTYVVWFAPANRPASVAGTLEYDEDDREGKMSATNETKTFEVIVSAERNAQVSVPSEQVVARFRVDAR